MPPLSNQPSQTLSQALNCWNCHQKNPVSIETHIYYSILSLDPHNIVTRPKPYLPCLSNKVAAVRRSHTAAEKLNL